jgi:hypothetical protein
LPPFYEQAKAKGWKAFTMSCGDDVMLDQPEELPEELLQVRGSRTRTGKRENR